MNHKKQPNFDVSTVSLPSQTCLLCQSWTWD